jgi:DNA/RNA endonuclease YhcR with UshA esterase domain
MLMNVRFLLIVWTLAIPALAAEDKEKPLSPAEARKQIDKKITVEMEVKSAKNALEKRGEIYLDSEEDFRDEKNFAVVITKKGAESLGAAGIDNPADHFKGKTIRAKGTVKEVDGIPRIEIDDAEQIQIPKKK